MLLQVKTKLTFEQGGLRRDKAGFSTENFFEKPTNTSKKNKISMCPSIERFLNPAPLLKGIN